MKDEIKVGEYIRTVKGTIAKVCAYQDLRTYDENNIGVTFHSFDTDKGAIADIELLKHSFNIIDLIEVGDYVNGHLVVDLDKNIYNQKLVITEVDGKNGAIRHHYLEKSIKSIVTKEQFEAMEYEV